MHHGRYRRLSEDEAAQLVAEHDDPERHLGLVSDWKEKGHEHYLDWFCKDWSSPMDASQFYEILRRAGFIER